jgi:hypothetical protein
MTRLSRQLRERTGSIAATEPRFGGALVFRRGSWHCRVARAFSRRLHCRARSCVGSAQLLVLRRTLSHGELIEKLEAGRGSARCAKPSELDQIDLDLTIFVSLAENVRSLPHVEVAPFILRVG